MKQSDNWEESMKTMRERFDKEFLVIDKTWTRDDFMEIPSDINPNKLKDFIEQELTKKDQEHKAKLESIKGDVERKSFTIMRGMDIEEVVNLQDAIHIVDNKLNE